MKLVKGRDYRIEKSIFRSLSYYILFDRWRGKIGLNHVFARLPISTRRKADICLHVTNGGGGTIAIARTISQFKVGRWLAARACIKNDDE